MAEVTINTTGAVDQTGVDPVFVNEPLQTYRSELREKFPPNNQVLLIQIPQTILQSFNADVARKRGYYAFPPTGLQYLYQSLKNRGLDVRIFDLNLELLKRVHQDEAYDHSDWVSLLEEYLETFDPFIVGVSCMFDAGIAPLIQVLDFLKSRERSVTITGGVVSTYEYQNLLDRDLCHFVIKGEGENKLNFLFDHLTGKAENHAQTPDICFKPNDTVIQTQGPPDAVAVQGDLIDSYSQVPVEEYHNYGSLNPFSRIAGIYKSPYAAIQMNRGCRAACTFCAVRDFNGRFVRTRPVDEVLSEMDFLINHRGVRHFEWLDDDLLFAKKDLQYLLESIIERKWKITWSANNGLIAAVVDEKTMQLIQDSGCIGFKIGIETGNAEMLRAVKKPGTLAKFREFGQMIKDYDQVFVGGNFIIGFPDERFSQMMDSFWFNSEMHLDWAAFTICQIIRGASAFSDFEDYFVTQMDSDGELIKNFLPVRDSASGQIAAPAGVSKGLDVFDLDPDLVPTEEQNKEIWFTFNLVGNYINNKNLRPGGRVEKFISWVEMAQTAYPTNPYMSLFLALAYVIDDQPEKAAEHFQQASNLHKTEYWNDRFTAFGLMELLEELPASREGAYQVIEDLRQRTMPVQKIPDNSVIG